MRGVVTLAVLLCAAAPAQADLFRLLDDDRAAAQARVDLIQQAQREIAAVYFLAYDDRITTTALALLREARRRGVQPVRLIVDANFQHIPRAVLAHLRDEGVEVRVYHPVTLRHPTWLFHRMHEKFVVIDGARYITGGRNLAESYFGLTRRNYVDRDIYVDGPSAAEATRHFNELWSCSDVCALRVRVTPAEKLRAAAALDAAARGEALRGFIALDTATDWSAGARDIGDVRFFHDPVKPGSGPRINERLMDALDAARSSIVIESPYVVPSRELIELLERKAAAGVTVRIVTNSLRATDGVLPYAGYLKYRRRLRRAGLDLREYRGPDTLHAKTFVIDGRTVFVGSYNLDPRSRNLNAEVMCAAADEAVAGELLASIDAHAAKAWKVGAREPRPRAPRAWRLRAFAARLLMPLLEPQL